jgi:hypothetical protein
MLRRVILQKRELKMAGVSAGERVNVSTQTVAGNREAVNRVPCFGIAYCYFRDNSKDVG